MYLNNFINLYLTSKIAKYSRHKYLNHINDSVLLQDECIKGFFASFFVRLGSRKKGAVGKSTDRLTPSVPLGRLFALS